MGKQEIKQAVQASLVDMPFGERIDKISLFGSYLHENANKDSDVDLLVEFNKPVSFFQLYDIEQKLQQSLGSEVDVVTPKALSKYFRDEVMQEAEVLYER